MRIRLHRTSGHIAPWWFLLCHPAWVPGTNGGLMIWGPVCAVCVSIGRWLLIVERR